jgi:hypothetical protein
MARIVALAWPDDADVENTSSAVSTWSLKPGLNALADRITVTSTSLAPMYSVEQTSHLCRGRIQPVGSKMLVRRYADEPSTYLTSGFPESDVSTEAVNFEMFEFQMAWWVGVC